MDVEVVQPKLKEMFICFYSAKGRIRGGKGTVRIQKRQIRRIEWWNCKGRVGMPYGFDIGEQSLRIAGGSTLTNPSFGRKK